MAEWKTARATGLLADLQPGGDVYGHSGCHARLLRLHKTDLISDLRKDKERIYRWKIEGDPDKSSRYAVNRRFIVVWLGK